MTSQIKHDESCESDWGLEGQETPCRCGQRAMARTTYEKPFLVNIEGPDDIEEFDTMREAVDRANEINAHLVETVGRGGEHAPHLWAVPWRTSMYLARSRHAEPTPERTP